MLLRPRAACLLLLGALLAACDPATVVQPSSSVEPGSSADASDGPLPTNPVVGQLAGPWRRSPMVLDDGHIAIFSDACAAKARDTLGSDAADLPTAVVDAQGQSFAIVVLADDVDAVECLLDIDPSGDAARATEVAWLSRSSLDVVEGTGMTVAVYRHSDDGKRTISIGRIGPDAIKPKITFDDASVIQAANGEGWWATWWQGVVPAATFVTTDSKDIVIGHAQRPTGLLDGRAGVASWWIDPTKPAPKATSTTIAALVLETACASATSPKDRIEEPIVDAAPAAITVIYRIRRLPDPQDCQGNQPLSVELILPEPLGNRTLLDGGSDPPRDAAQPPP